MRRTWLLALGVPFLAVIGYKLMYPTYRWHQKVTVEVQVGDQLRSASSVSEVSVAFVPQVLPDASPLNVSLRGEAVVLPIPDRGVLFALLSNSSGIAGRVFGDRLPGGSARANFSTLAGLREARDVSPENDPLLVTFGDIADPKTVRRIDPADLAASFGPGVALRRITLEITDEAVTEGRVETVLPWLEAVGRERATLIPDPPRLATDLTDPKIQLLAPDAFSTELYK